MKTVLIINPCAGQGGNLQQLARKIESLSGFDTEIYITAAPGDATRYVRQFCETSGSARFIACGGDGTLNEVLNGAIGFENAEIGVIPVGTGNDFCRNFSFADGFEDVLSQVTGETMKCDAIKYTTVVNGETRSGYCANMFNIGFDCNVADLTAKMKKKRFVFGPMAYFLSIFATLVAKKGANLEIKMDGKVRHCGKLLLTSVANGSCCGGGIKSNPLASVRDGKINVNIIKNVSRTRLLYLLPFYMKGSHLKLKNIDSIIMTEDCLELELIPIDDALRICVDGEIIDAGKTKFEICPGAFNFVVPVKQKIKKKEPVTV